MKSPVSVGRLSLVLAILCIGLAMVAIGAGGGMGPGDLVAALAGGGSATDRLILFEIRLPRLAAGFVVGASLGLAGGALQGLLRNPLAEPGLLGISSTAALFAAFALHWGLIAASPLLLPGLAMGGALVAILFLAMFAGAWTNGAGLVLAGAGLASFSAALTALMLNFAPNPFSLANLVNWLMGSVENRSFEDLAISAPFMAIGAACLIWRGRDLSALALGAETAFSLGVDVRRSRLILILGAGLLTGGAVALACAVGFVGLAAPWLARALTGGDPARALLPAALLGGTMTMAADLVARSLPFGDELKLGVAAALFGAPLFVAIVAIEARRHVWSGAGHG